MTVVLSALEETAIADSPTFLLRLSEDAIIQLTDATPVAVRVGPNSGSPLSDNDGLFTPKSCRFLGGLVGSATGTYAWIAPWQAVSPVAGITLMLLMSDIRNQTPSSGVIGVVNYIGSGGGYSINLDSTGNVVFHCYYGTSPSAYVEVKFSRTLLNASGTLVHFTFDGRFVGAYVNGVKVDSFDLGQKKSITYLPNTSLIIGTRADSISVPVNGTQCSSFDLSLFGVFAVALTAAQIQGEVESWSTPPSNLAGTAFLDDGQPASSVVIAEWIGTRKGVVVPQNDGAWQAEVPPGDYLITARGPSGYRPISHGPVTAVDP